MGSLPRYSIERSLLGIPPIVPLDSEGLKADLGPGYTVGYFGSDWNMGSRLIFQRTFRIFVLFRRDNCILEPKETKKLDKKWLIVQQYIKRGASEESFGKHLNNNYHTDGHLSIGGNCKTDPKTMSCAMSFDVVSARDPIFYRWSKRVLV